MEFLSLLSLPSLLSLVWSFRRAGWNEACNAWRG